MTQIIKPVFNTIRPKSVLSYRKFKYNIREVDAVSVRKLKNGDGIYFIFNLKDNKIKHTCCLYIDSQDKDFAKKSRDILKQILVDSRSHFSSILTSSQIQKHCKKYLKEIVKIRVHYPGLISSTSLATSDYKTRVFVKSLFLKDGTEITLQQDRVYKINR